MKDHEINDEKPITLEEIPVCFVYIPFTVSWPLKLELNHKLKKENMNNPEFIENYSWQIYFNPKNRKKAKWAIVIWSIDIIISWIIILLSISQFIIPFNENSLKTKWILSAFFLIFSLWRFLPNNGMQIYFQYLKAKTYLLHGHKTQSWREDIQRNYKFRGYRFTNINLDYNASNLVNNLDNEKAGNLRQNLSKIRLFSALNRLTLFFTLGFLVGYILWVFLK